MNQLDIGWATRAAEKVLEKFGDAVAIDTADYRLCGFILAAARVAVEDPTIAEKIGRLMEAERRY